MANTVVHFTGGDVFGGAEQTILNIVEGLDPSRWRPILLHYDESRLTPLPERARKAGARVIPVARLDGRPALRRLAALVRALKAEKPSVFHAHLSIPQYAGLALVAAVVARVPTIVATQQLFEEFTSRASFLLQRLVSRRVGCYVAVSQSVAMRLERTLKIPPRKVRVIHNGIFPERFQAPCDPKVRQQLTGGSELPVVFTSARLHSQKGIEFLIEAAALVPHAFFAIAGAGPQREMLEQKCRGLGLAGRVAFLGHRDDIPALLAASDVFVLPSLNEGLPVSVLEAMAASKPVIATRIGGTDEAVVDGETGLLVPPANPAALAHAIRTVLANPEMAHRMGVNGLRRARAEFSAGRMALQVSELYGELLDSAA